MGNSSQPAQPERVKMTTVRRKAGGIGMRFLALLLGSAVPGVSALADNFHFDNGIEGDYKLTVNYGVGMRMKDPDPALINGPVDPLQPNVLPPGQLVGFGHTGLPTTINLD